jgi:hypothetical protein
MSNELQLAKLIIAGKNVVPGTVVRTFGDEQWIFDGITRLPDHGTGRVQLSRPCGHAGNEHETEWWCKGAEVREFFPSVIEARIEVA